VGETLALLKRLVRRYDLALSTQAGDRPIALAWCAGRRSVGPLPSEGWSRTVKSWALSRSYTGGPTQHHVLDVLRLTEALGITPVAEIVCPQGALRPDLIPTNPYAVLHAAPMFQYKRWTAAGWRALAAALRTRGVAPVVVGAVADRSYLDEIWAGCDVARLDGRLMWPELAALLGAAQLYIGPDTAVTHLAAATGAPTVALYGPTDPRIWGPWPAGGLARAWEPAGTLQRRGNVWLVQNPLPCLPCQKEGCARRLDSHSQCLDELTAGQVVEAIDQALATRRAAGRVGACD
jgi:heptosyltransferase-3